MTTNNDTIKGEVIDEEATESTPKKKLKFPKITKRGLILGATVVGTAVTTAILTRLASDEPSEDSEIIIGEITENVDGSTTYTVTEVPANHEEPAPAE